MQFLRVCKNSNLVYNSDFIYLPYEDKLLKELIEFDKINELNNNFISNVPRAKIFEYLKKADFLVLTSIRDPLPTVILESFSVGTPVIAHSIGGVPEMVLDGFNGFLYDKTSEFSKIIETLKVADNNLYNQLSLNSLNTIKEKFNIQNKIDILDSILFP